MPRKDVMECILMLLIVGCSSSGSIAPSHEELNASIVACYGSRSRLMRGDDAISQAIIDRYCLAESKDDFKADATDRFKSGWRPWLCGPMPATYDESQNEDGTYHVRYKPENLDASGTPKDVWTHKGVVNIGFDEFCREIAKARSAKGAVTCHAKK